MFLFCIYLSFSSVNHNLLKRKGRNWHFSHLLIFFKHYSFQSYSESGAYPGNTGCEMGIICASITQRHTYVHTFLHTYSIYCK